jgi:hypothetical protein
VNVDELRAGTGVLRRSRWAASGELQAQRGHGEGVITWASSEVRGRRTNKLPRPPCGGIHHGRCR